jgi:hypothetical protein
VFTLENPLLPVETPLNDNRLWYKNTIQTKELTPTDVE